MCTFLAAIGLVTRANVFRCAVGQLASDTGAELPIAEHTVCSSAGGPSTVSGRFHRMDDCGIVFDIFPVTFDYLPKPRMLASEYQRSCTYTRGL